MNKLIAISIASASIAIGAIPAVAEPFIPVHTQRLDDYGNLQDCIEAVRLVDVGSVKKFNNKVYANYRIDCNNRYNKNLDKTYEWLEADCRRSRIRTGSKGSNFGAYWLVRKQNGEWHEEGTNHRYGNLVNTSNSHIKIYDEWDSSLFDFVCGN